MTTTQHYQQIPDYLLNDRALNPQDIKVYAALRSHLGKNQYVFPSVQTLAKEIDTSPSTVDRSLRNLRQRGHIDRKRVGNGKSARTYFKTLVNGGKVTTGQPLGLGPVVKRSRPKRAIVSANLIDVEEMELYYIKEREENLAATYAEYSWEDCRHVKFDVPDTSSVMCSDTSPVTH